MIMGKTCSKSANELDLENRRISREVRLKLAPPSSRQSLARSVRQGGADVVPCSGSVGCQESCNVSQSEYKSLSLRFRDIYTRRFLHAPVENARRSMPSKSQASSGVVYSRDTPFSRVDLRRAACSPRQKHHVTCNFQNRSSGERSMAKISPRFALKQEVHYSTAGNRSALPKKIKGMNPFAKTTQKPNTSMTANVATSSRSTKTSTYLLSKQIKKPKVKPVVMQALNLLSALEIQCRSAIVNEALLAFGSFEAQLEYFTGLETVRKAAFAIFELQTSSREAVIEQEKNEWFFLTHWFLELLEEGRLVALIEKTEKGQQISAPYVKLTPHQEIGGHPARTELRLPENKKISDLRHSKSRKRDDGGLCFMMNYRDKHNSSQSVFSYSTPYMKEKTSSNALRKENLGSEDLESKIRRQTQLIQETVPPYFPKGSFSPRAYDYLGQSVEIERDYNNCRESPSPRPSRVVQDLYYSFQEPPLFEPMYRHNRYGDHTFLNRSTSLKEASDMALKRRLNTILRD